MATYKVHKGEFKKIENRNIKQSERVYKTVPSLLIKIKNIFQNLFDDRARSTDFICLLILVDNFYLTNDILNFIFYFLSFKYMILFLGSFYIIYFKKYINYIETR